MAVQKSNISVVVVEGEISALHRFDFPFPTLASVQDAGVLLRDASWDIRKSTTGLSVSFFWPTFMPNQARTTVNAKSKRKRKGRHRRKKKTAEVQPELPPSKEPVSSHPPVDAHFSVNNVELATLPCLTTDATAEVSQLALAVTVTDQGQAIPHDARLSDVVEPEMRLVKKVSLNDSILDNPQSLYEVYYELDKSIPGVHVESDEKFFWSSIKITRYGVKVASDQ